MIKSWNNILNQGIKKDFLCKLRQKYLFFAPRWLVVQKAITKCRFFHFAPAICQNSLNIPLKRSISTIAQATFSEWQPSICKGSLQRDIAGGNTGIFNP
ncbi:MAG: hypothetical protein ACOYOO_07440 [Saprospiraceae bacterium]